MQALAEFFESINRALGVSGPGELIFHPVFIGLCLAIFIYALVIRMKYLALVIGGLMGGGAIYHYLYPQDSSFVEVAKLLGALGALVLVLVYFGFIRE